MLNEFYCGEELSVLYLISLKIFFFSNKLKPIIFIHIPFNFENKTSKS